MLLLCSDGLSSPALLEALGRRLPPSGRRAAIVVTADQRFKLKSHNIPRNSQELAALGYQSQAIDLDKIDPQALLDYDLVEFIGGNPFYLLRSIRRKEAEPVLRQLMNEKILVGWSAGAIVFGPSLELIHRYTPEMNRKGWVKTMEGLGFCPYALLPHYKAFLSRFERLEERAQDYERESGVPVLRLSDGEGLLLDGGEELLISLEG